MADNGAFPMKLQLSDAVELGAFQRKAVKRNTPNDIEKSRAKGLNKKRLSLSITCFIGP